MNRTESFQLNSILRIGCENLVSEQYRLPPVLTDPILVDQVSGRHSLILLG